MRRIFPFVLLLALGLTLHAKPVDPNTARLAGTHFLQSKKLLKANDTLTLYQSYGTDEGKDATCFYVFNHASGFVIISADDRCVPVLGYSCNGSFRQEKLPANMANWLDNYRQEIQQALHSDAPANPENETLWKELIDGNLPQEADSKSDDYLLTSTWEQGHGYNQYCPTMNGRHVVVGCVATAMAQIIRYHEFPTRGFGKKSYAHVAYGVQAVNFDTTDYDYSLMPDHVSYYAPDEQIDMVSRLCYHCGVVVNMEYEHAGHTSGSGAHTSKVPEGLMYFGYTDARHYIRTDINNDSLWVAMIHTEIDNRRPIEYSGFGDGGGHAFVLDGYNHQNHYHFNWGWGGYCDGFYTLTTMQGFTSTHEMVVNIHPSGWDGHLQKFHVTPDGNGNGASWAEANSNLSAAIALNQLVSRDIWVKEGTYYGDTNGDYAFRISNAVNITGGFAGTETATSQRNAQAHPTILDGGNRHGVLDAVYHGSSSKTIKLTDLILQNGYSEKGRCIRLAGDNITANALTIRHCLSDSGTVLLLSNSLMRYAQIEGNTAPTICQLDDGILRQSLVNNNDGDGLVMGGSATAVNNTIANNKGYGVVFSNKQNTFINNIVWNNDTAIRMSATASDSNIRSNAFSADSLIGDSTNIRLSLDNMDANGPKFLQAATTCGTEGLNATSDWHLGWGSVCIDAGERVSESVVDGDKDRTIRCRNGRIDLGCYESNYPAALDSPANALCRIYPNPATTALNIESADGRLQIYDLAGRLIHQATLRDGHTTIDVSRWNKGAYLLRITTSEGSTNQKIVIK